VRTIGQKTIDIDNRRRIGSLPSECAIIPRSPSNQERRERFRAPLAIVSSDTRREHRLIVELVSKVRTGDASPGLRDRIDHLIAIDKVNLDSRLSARTQRVSSRDVKQDTRRKMDETLYRRRKTITRARRRN